MPKKKFPKLIHVTWEEVGTNDDPYLAVQMGGVFDVETHNEPIAVYQLVKAGRVEIRKRMVEKP